MDDSINMTHTAHSECVNGVGIVAEETTPRHLSGGDGDTKKACQICLSGQAMLELLPSPKISADSMMNISSKPTSSNPHRHTLKI